MSLPAYVQQLAASQFEAEKLGALGADSPDALLGMIVANREAFDSYLGPTVATRVVNRIYKLFPQARSVSALEPPGTLGVPLDPGPAKPLPARFDVQKRDAIYRQVEMLRRSGAPRTEIEQAEKALDQYLAAGSP